MNIYALLALSLVPVAAVFLLLVILVPGLKIRYALWACTLGVITVFPAAFVQYYVLNLPIFYSTTLLNLLVTAVVFNGLIEEAFKMLFIAAIPQKKMSLPAFFACAVLSGLTLGSIESIIYLIKEIGAALFPLGAKDLLKLLFSRMFTSVIIHTLCAGLSGLYLWLFRRKTRKIMPFFWAVILHGCYNFFAGFKSGFYLFSIVAILFAALECRIWYEYSKNNAVSVDTTEN